MWPTLGFFSPGPWIICTERFTSDDFCNEKNMNACIYCTTNQQPQSKANEIPHSNQKTITAAMLRTINACMLSTTPHYQQPSWPTTMTAIGRTHSKSKEQMLTYLWVIVRKGCVSILSRAAKANFKGKKASHDSCCCTTKFSYAQHNLEWQTSSVCMKEGLRNTLQCCQKALQNVAHGCKQPSWQHSTKMIENAWLSPCRIQQ